MDLPISLRIFASPLLLAPLIAASTASATVIHGVNAWQLTVVATTVGTDTNGFETEGSDGDTSNSGTDPRSPISISNECAGGTSCGLTGMATMGTYEAVADLATFSAAARAAGGGSATITSAGSGMQLNIPLVGSIAPGNQALGTVTMTLEGGGVPDGSYDQLGSSPSVYVGASIITCTFAPDFSSSNGDCTTSTYMNWYSDANIACDPLANTQPCGPIEGAFPTTLESEFLVDSDHTILHLQLGVGTTVRGVAAADVSETRFVITPPDGFVADLSGLTGVPEPGADGSGLAASLGILLLARRRSGAAKERPR
jgi:hypothetical protein